MISYPARAARALGRLNRPYNDIDIYVEDTSNRNMWNELIKSIIPPSVRFRGVIQLGGKSKVLEACKLDQKRDDRSKLYIVDGDFDYVLGKRSPRLNFLYRVGAYCIENVLLSEKAVCYVGLASKPEWSEDQIKEQFDFNSWQAKLTRVLKNVFISYAVAHALAPGIETVGFSVRHLYINTTEGPSICPHKAYKRVVNVIRKACARSGLAAVRLKRLKVVRNSCNSIHEN